MRWFEWVVVILGCVWFAAFAAAILYGTGGPDRYYLRELKKMRRSEQRERERDVRRRTKGTGSND